MISNPTGHPSSYRDPAGFVFEKDGVFFRQVNKVFSKDFDFFIQSGLYEKLVAKGMLISHEEMSNSTLIDLEAYKILKPAPISFISYPYEWTFDMLKDAAMLTLAIQRTAIDAGMTLKDATPYNVQWLNGQLIFIDTLSFERYKEDEPWTAYRQFCECFLSPLLLMHHSGHSMQQLLLAYPDGIPLPITSSLLPRRTRFSLHTYLHVHLHGKMQQKKNSEKKIVFSRKKLLNILTSLETLVRKLKSPGKTVWSNYYDDLKNEEEYLSAKKNLVSQWVQGIEYKTATDLGANDGTFSRLIAKNGIRTIAVDSDAYSINRLYNELKKETNSTLYPVVADIANPSPATGFNNKERSPLLPRLHSELVMALALVHHLAIGRNLPLPLIAELFSGITSKYLLIEFVPREDEKVQRMLSGRRDIFTFYDQKHFEQAFSKYFRIQRQEKIAGSERTLYLMSLNEI